VGNCGAEWAQRERSPQPSAGRGVLMAQVRAPEKESRTLANVIAKLRVHNCLGPERGFYHTLSWL
jgi:porphobilinogen deaminase